MNKSKDYISLKEQAINLRISGQSYRQISSDLNVARSTLNGWLKNVILTEDQQQILHQRWLDGLERARLKAGQRSKLAKLNRINEGLISAQQLLANITLNNLQLELFMAGLYLGEGFKKDNRFGLGNANPDIVLLFVTLLRKLYPIKEEKLRGAVYGRADQNSAQLIHYWSSLLDIPANQFHKTQLDIRTVNKPTRENYFGVCTVSYNDSSIQRRILAISKEMIKYINKPNNGSVAHLVRASH